MKTRKILSVAVLFAFFTCVLHAQMRTFNTPTYKDVLALKDREVIVVVNPPNQKIIDSLTKGGYTDALKAYQKAIDDYNADMKNAVTKFWTFNSKAINYKTRKEIKVLYQDKSQRDKYVLIYCSSLGKGYANDMDWNIDKDGKKIKGARVIFSVGGGFDVDPIYQWVPAHLIPGSIDIYFFVSETNFLFNYMLGRQKDCKMQDMIAENAHLLSQKTLLILSNTIKKDCIDNIKTVYPYKFKVLSVPTEKLADAVSSGDAKSAYIITTGAGGLYMNWVVSCADGAILAYTDFGKEAALLKTQKAFDKDFFQDIAKFCPDTLKK